MCFHHKKREKRFLFVSLFNGIELQFFTKANKIPSSSVGEVLEVTLLNHNNFLKPILTNYIAESIEINEEQMDGNQEWRN